MEYNFTCIRDVTLGVPRTAHDSESALNCMGIYTAFDCVPLSHVFGDSPNGLRTDLKFQNRLYYAVCSSHVRQSMAKLWGEKELNPFT